MSSSKEDRGGPKTNKVNPKDNAMIEMPRDGEADPTEAEGSWKTVSKKKKKKATREDRDRYREPGYQWIKESRNDKRKNRIKRLSKTADAIENPSPPVESTKDRITSGNPWVDHLATSTTPKISGHRNEEIPSRIECKEKLKIDTMFDNLAIKTNHSELTSKTGITQATTKTPYSISVPQCNFTPQFSHTKVRESWTPEEKREQRTKEKKTKVRRIAPKKPICGGDIIVSESGATMTLSVAFQGTGKFERKTYGLTCNHLMNEGDSDEIFVMTSSNINAESDQHTFKKLIGNVVSRDKETDSLIFEFRRDVEVDANKIKTGPGPDDVHEIDVYRHLSTIPSASMALVAFGSQRRGTYGRVVPDERPPNLPPSALGIESNDLGSQPGSKLVSHDEDCGMIYVDENGNPMAMHVGFTAKKINDGDILYRSWAIHLFDIMRNHKREFFEGVHNYSDNVLLASVQTSSGRAKPLPPTNTRKPRNGNPAIIRGFPLQGYVPTFDELPIETQLKIQLELADDEAERSELLAKLTAEESKRANDGVS